MLPELENTFDITIGKFPGSSIAWDKTARMLLLINFAMSATICYRTLIKKADLQSLSTLTTAFRLDEDQA